MALIDFDQLSKQYAYTEDDFGFSAVSEEDYNAKIAEVVEKVNQPIHDMANDYKSRLQEVEKLIIPFLIKLQTTGDKEYIYWPNRKPIIEKQIEKILKLTRD